jgi:3-(3-hydroxy-phenyl)propionate hydroxylase
MLHGSRGARFMSPPSAAEKILRDAVLQLSGRIPALAQLVNPRQHAAAVLDDSPLNATVESTADGVSSDFVAGPIPGAVLTECPLRLHDAPDAIRPDAIRQGYVTDLLGPWISVLVFSANGKLPMPLLQAAQQAAHTLPLRLALITRNPPASNATDTASTLSAEAVLQYAYDPAGKLFALYGATVGNSPATEPSLTVYVVRPDGHVCARWHQSSEADGSVLQQALRRLCGVAAA